MLILSVYLRPVGQARPRDSWQGFAKEHPPQHQVRRYLSFDIPCKTPTRPTKQQQAPKAKHQLGGATVLNATLATGRRWRRRRRRRGCPLFGASTHSSPVKLNTPQPAPLWLVRLNRHAQRPIFQHRADFQHLLQMQIQHKRRSTVPRTFLMRSHIPGLRSGTPTKLPVAAE
jgi:hypothetical protein